ncbi:uncharacterized protein ASCRUDRAFT_10765 [Ascoidea rubescens DSM 1968]|uniref:Uncharacterized protein n=1 Tax=Ascoidea rubescens DSM 1968 TaxID=1344418 RepID=A0A1D2VNN9_9ASCO|nr:hypothetical protein ASCRUDRAFT_10765 [Ascoidea rubescens DSM 1968]ODV63220.1 hypothetical protein ASCRUDRAFT_10765 [Ascoidea rubescens DSM 1968]
MISSINYYIQNIAVQTLSYSQQSKLESSLNGINYNYSIGEVLKQKIVDGIDKTNRKLISYFDKTLQNKWVIVSSFSHSEEISFLDGKAIKRAELAIHEFSSMFQLAEHPVGSQIQTVNSSISEIQESITYQHQFSSGPSSPWCEPENDNNNWKI